VNLNLRGGLPTRRDPGQKRIIAMSAFVTAALMVIVCQLWYSAPQANAPVHRRPMAAVSAAGGAAPKAMAARRTTSAAPMALATPSVFAMSSDGPTTAAAPPSSSVHSGAVEPDTGSPGL